jgi:histidyl-tRNA synthetase
LQISSIVDKKAKITKEVFEIELLDIWLDKKQIDKITSFLDYEVTFENLESIKDILKIENTEFDKWINELKITLDFIYKMWINREDIKINFSIIRWLDYYTWIVFETFIVNDRKLGSVGSWGRYENLTKNIDAKSNFSGVGFSIWVTRLEDYLFENLEDTNLSQTTSEYLIINFSETINASLWIYNKLIWEWKSVEFYPENDKLSKQFKYADNKKIKYCVILWEQELEKWVYILKNMFTWESLEKIIN